MVKVKEVGTVGDNEVTLIIDGSDEQLANMIYADIVGRLTQISRGLKEGTHPDEQDPSMTVDWHSYDG